MIVPRLQNADIVALPFYDLSESLVVLVYTWRNDERIRKWMNNTSVIKWADHLHFVETSRLRQDRVDLLVQKSGRPIGVINLTNIDPATSQAELGLYRRPDEPRRNHGKVLLETVELVAVQLGLEKLVLRVKRVNERAFELYEQAGYAAERSDEQFHYMEKKL